MREHIEICYSGDVCLRARHFLLDFFLVSFQGIYNSLLAVNKSFACVCNNYQKRPVWP